jgi:hypothetical protein
MENTQGLARLEHRLKIDPAWIAVSVYGINGSCDDKPICRLSPENLIYS